MAKIGLIARADNTGLGYQTKSYYKWLKPSKTLVVNMRPLNGMPQHFEWYPDGYITEGFPTQKEVTLFLRNLDVVITAETPYNFEIYSMAKQMGVKTVCVENPEFYDHIKYPDLPTPDVIILPSMWLYDEIKAHAESKGIQVFQIHHPVDRQDFPYRKRTTKKIIHIAGKPAVNDRNGTWDFMKAFPNGVITTQSTDLAKQITMRYRHCNVFSNVEDPKFLYQLGDVLVFPRKYGGNCLPLNEALSTGMPVIMPDISPNNHLLPEEWLVKANYIGFFEPRTKVDMYQVDESSMAQKAEWIRNCNIEEESEKANKIADSISWENLLDKYLEVLS
jgi:glycosyltransferase involved in cell wall biosynthesis